MINLIKKKYKKNSMNKSSKVMIKDFDEKGYLDVNPDVVEGISNGDFQNVQHHLETFGFNEIKLGYRKFHYDFELFDASIYAKLYMSLNEITSEEEVNKVFKHFCIDGYKKIIEGVIYWSRSGMGDDTDSLVDNKEKNTFLVLKEEVFKNHPKYDEYMCIQPSKLFDEEYYLEQNPDIKETNTDCLLHYISLGYKEGRNPNKTFDTFWYMEHYQDIAAADMNPLLHYCIAGKEEGRFQNKSEYEQYNLHISEGKTIIINELDDDENFLYQEISRANIDWSQYFIENTHTPFSKDPIIDYIKNWKEYKPSITNFFDTDFYLLSNIDIKNTGMNPLYHYVANGKEEGRRGCFNIDNVVQGRLSYDEKKESIVFVTHESSASGAPLLGYGITNKLVEKYNIIHIVLKKSNIHDVFFNNCDLMLHDISPNVYTNTYFFIKQIIATRTIKCIMINSIIGYEVVDVAREFGLPTVVLIHEFSEYMRPFGTIIKTVMHSDHIVVPATIIQDSIQKEFRRFANYKKNPKNIHILPQGKLPYIPDTYGDNDSIEDLYKKLKIGSSDDVKIIVGSGWVQIRKGVDLFIAIARYIKNLYGGDCKFVWVGEGFDPDDDLAYSVYLDREIEFSGLGDDFIFLEHQKNLDTIFSIADVFCLTSRMDPFPNVVIDALAQDLHIACFNHASGSAEFLQQHNANCTIADFVDTYELAEGVVNYLNTEDKKEGINRNILEQYLNFDIYVKELDKLVMKAEAFKLKSQTIVNKLLESGEFNENFYNLEGKSEILCREYVENGLKGFHFKNPKLGFSEMKWLHENPQSGLSVVPLYEALCAEKTLTHEIVKVPYKSKSNVNFVYAIHLHLYYVDLAEVFAKYFSKLPGMYDLLITIVSEEEYDIVEEVFSVCNARSVKIVCVENIGRDMGPLFFALKDEILNGGYEVIGHFHSKKSLVMATDSGDKWLEFLMENLIGNTDVAQSVLELFNNPEVGLVFPEDTNASDIGENSIFVANLCKMLNLPLVDQTPLFPIGNMFWARVDAIKELFGLDRTKILQKEPLPYDGSYMHAIERITPSLVEKNGYKYITVYKENTKW